MTTVRMNMSAYAIERDEIEAQGCDDALAPESLATGIASFHPVPGDA